MAEAQVALDTNGDHPNNHYSRPVFKLEVLKVNSLQAQRVMERSFERISTPCSPST
ncbi:hypothetical protein [Klebsiella pneumoniae]|uniref:hypothetical protein n=1 Tax=Klebsiella pneumoniae TaxID=573 RepID=UPI002949191B|nr:hypothetical protein [Klebsiella pneumoniae]MDV5545190.1 hypothetical protein [Klebsiella pneumoniae]